MRAAGGDFLPAINVELPGGVNVLAQLDSGANAALSLPMSFADRLPLYAPLTVVGRATTVSGVTEVYGARVRGTIRIGPVTLENPNILFHGLVANVGLPILRQMTVVLDPAEQRSWVLRPALLGNADLTKYAGQYDERSIRVADGTLVYQRAGRDPAPLTFLGEDMFENGATGDRIEFRREGERVTGFDLITVDGQIVAASRAD